MVTKLTGSLLRAGRALVGISRDELASRTGLSRDAIRDWERSSDAIVPAQYQMLIRAITALEHEGRSPPMRRWTSPDNPYKGRSHGVRLRDKYATGGKVSTGDDFDTAKGFRKSTTKHPTGRGETTDNWLRGTTGESHPNYHKTGR